MLDDQQEVAGEGSDYSPTTPPGSDGEGAAVAQEREKRRKVQESSSPDPFYTRHCPACESGMDVPGIRHNAECKKKRASLSVKPAVSGPPALTDAPAGPSVPSGPRASPDYFDDNWDIVPSPEGDAVMADGPPGGEENVPMEYGIIDLNQCGVLAKPSCLSDLHLVSIARLNVESIAYDGSKGEFKVIDFCGGRVKLWKPSHVISDTTLGELDPEGTSKAMQKECDGLTAVRAGVILSEKQKDDFCKRHGVKPITCRWVTNEKPESEEGVRARIVVKDIARGSATARSLAISSPTPSVESLRMVLGAASGSWGVELSLHAIDVSQAFMNSPLRDHERIILRFPLSLSTMSGEPIFIEAHKALNGLRVASLTWSVFLKDIVSKVNLACSTTEPCLYGGVIDGSPTLLLCYVDDLLVASSSDKAFHRVFKELSKHVKVRETGKISLSKEGGGSLKFLGRMISRQSGSPTLVMQVDASYMDGACEEFGIKVPKGVASPPDIKPSLEATVEESPISPEAHSRYRRVLGRLAWLAQTRMDLLHYTSLLASGQSEPRPGHEKALRQVLRFVAADSRVGQHFPISDGEEHHLNEKEVIVYSDAVFAPMRVFERRSISGAVLIYRQVTLKCFSRHQHAVSLSSCEAELHALQSAVQEAIGLARTLAFVLKSLNLRKDLPALEFLEEGEVPLQILLRTDSLSGKQLLESYDLQKKSRHIEIRLCWLRKLLSIGSLELSFVRGDLNLSDMFTKCVGQALFQRFREAIGFATHDLHLSVLVTKSHEETSELFEDLEGKPVGSVSKLIPRICEVFQVREKIKKGPRCILCGDLLSQDFVFDGLHDSAAISGSTGFSLSAVTVTQLLEMSTDSDDDDRRSRREEREEVPQDVDSPKAPGKKRRRKSKLPEESAVAGEAVASEKPEDHEETPANKDAQGTEEVASVPPVKAPPVAPPGAKKDKKIVKEKKKEPKETKKAAKKEKVLPVAKFPPEEYSYYTTSEDEKPPPKPKPKAMPKEDGKKRKMPVAATPKKVAKARGRPKKKKAPSPSPSPTPTPSEESLDNGDIQEEEAEEEEEVSPSEMSEVFEAEGAAAVPSSKKEKKKHTRLVDDEEEMSRLMEESRRLVEAQRQIEMERAQLRAELRAKRAKKKAEEEAKKEEIRRQEEEDKKLAKKEAKDKENAEKKRLRDQAAEELKKEDESRIAEFRKNQTGYSREFFKSLENPDDPAQRKEFLRLHNEKVAAYQRSLKAQKLKEDLEEMKNKPPGQRLQEQRKIPVETDPWSRPAEFWNQSWKAVTAASLSKGYFHCGSQSCKKSFDNETAYWQHLYSKSGKPGHPSGEILANWKKESAGEPYVPLVMDPNWESGLQEEKKQAELKAKMAEALQSVSSEDESSESSNDTQESHTVHVTQAVFEDVRSAEGVPAEQVSEEDQKEKEVAKDVEDSKMPSEVGEKEGVEGTGDSKGPDEKEKDKEVDDPEKEKDKEVDDPEGPPKEAVEGVPSAKVEDPGKVDPKPTEKSVGSAEVHVPPEMPSGTDLPVEESAEAAAISGVLEGDIPTAGITTEGRTVPDPDREVCQGCYGTGMAEVEMNRPIRILRSASLIQVKREGDMNEAVTDEERKGPAKEEPAKRLDAVISQDVSCVKGSRNHVVVELCCSKESEMKQACRKIGLHYVGIHDRLEELSVFQVTMKMLSALVSSDLKSHGKGEKNLSLHLHISLPCTGGSPLLNFSTSQVRQEHVSMFLKLLKHVGRYIDSCKEFDPKVTVTFELPHNNRYWKLCEIREFRNRYGLDFEGIVSCCRTGLRAVRTGRLIGKRYRVVSNSESTSKVLNAKFAKCTCTEEHAAFNEVDWKQTEGYTRRFATVLIRTVLAFRFTAET